MEPQEAKGGTLYVVSTPIGNYRDVTQRARDILEVSKKAYGTVSKWRAIAKSNNLTSLAVNSMAVLKIGKV